MYTTEHERPYHIGSRIVDVVQGYRPQVDWGGDAGSPTIVVGGHNVQLATSGWRRRCLYVLLIALLLLSILNLSLTLWILKTTHFNVKGMGDLHVLIGGLKMGGTTKLMGKVTAAELRSGNNNNNILLEGYNNLTIQTTTADAFLHMGPDGVIAGGRRFTVLGADGRPVFDSQSEGSIVEAKRLTVLGSRGAVFDGGVQTPLVFSKGVHELRLDSTTRTVKLVAAREASLEARDGDITAIASNNININVEKGPIRFDNTRIYFSELLKCDSSSSSSSGGGSSGSSGFSAATTTATAMPDETQIPPPPPPPTTTTTTPSSSSSVEVYQVCVCPGGRLYLMPAKEECFFMDDICR